MNSPKVQLKFQLSPSYKSQISKSQAINTDVNEFFRNSIKLSMESSQMMSSSSLSNSKAFFKSEMKHLVKVVKKLMQMCKQKDQQLEYAKNKNKDYEEKISQLQSITDQEATTKCKEEILKQIQQEPSEKESKSDETKTRKKPKQNHVNPNQGLVDSMNQKISSFQFTISNKDNEKSEFDSLPSLISKILKENKYINQKYRNQYQQKLKDILALQAQFKQATQNFRIKISQLDEMQSENAKLKLQYKLLKSNYQNLQIRYQNTQEVLGKQINYYKILAENLKQVLRNLQKTKSPKKISKKDEQGYYSINKKMKQSCDSFSSQSDASSLKSSISGHIQRNLREENELLRTELIKALDQKGLMKSQLKKNTKMIERLKKQKYQLQKSQNFNEENNQNSINKKTEQIDDNFASKIFKKNKASTILVVENTQSKQRQIKQRHKLSTVLKQLKKVIDQVTGNQIEEMFEILQVKKEVFESFIKKLRDYLPKQSEFRSLLNKIKQQNQQLKKQKIKIQEKGKKDIAQLQSFLHEISQNKSQIKSQDSTDQAFKNIKLQKQNQQINEFFAQKERQYIEKINQQQRQIVALKNKIISLEQVNESFYKLTSQNPSSSFYNPSAAQNQIVPHSNLKGQSNMVANFENQVLQLSSFEMFKQKLTQFYQHTIKQLDQWEVSALKNFSPSMRPIPQIKSEVFQPSYRIPQIVQRNILKISRQFKSIKGTEEQNTPRSIQQGFENELFINQRMSKSFVQEEKKSETLEELINKRLIDFQQFSTDWIQKVVANTPNDQGDGYSSEKAQDETIKQQGIQCQSSKRMNMAMTQRPSVQRQKMFQIDMNEIDANSELIASPELIRERQLFIRQEFSYILPKNDSLNRLMKSSNSKKSIHSFRF